MAAKYFNRYYTVIGCLTVEVQTPLAGRFHFVTTSRVRRGVARVLPAL